MKTLLLCGYRTSDHEQDILGLSLDSEGLTLIDRRIVQLQALTRGEVIVVLAGTNAEEQLRQAPSIAHADLAFDTHEPCTLVSNARTGARKNENEACLILPVEIPPPPRALWDFLLGEYAKLGFATPHGLLQAVTAQGAPCHFGFPLLLTREGAKRLQTAQNLRSLLDERFQTRHLEYSHEAELDHSPKPL